MHSVPLAVMDYVGPALGALLFVAVMSLVAEPTRRTLNAVILAGASGVYLSGGFGLWELIYPVIGAAIGLRALRSYRWIGVGWLIHAGWDIAHHLWGNPIWPFMPSSAARASRRFAADSRTRPSTSPPVKRSQSTKAPMDAVHAAGESAPVQP